MNQDSQTSLLLTEFDVLPKLQGLIKFHYLLGIALFFSAIALVPLILGYLGTYNCMAVSIAPDRLNVPEVSIMFGFLAEFNHGLFYFLVMPIVIVLSLHCVLKTEATLKELARSGGAFSISGSDINGLRRFVGKLKTHSDPVSTFIWHEFTPEVRAKLEDWDNTDMGREDVEKVLIEALNLIILKSSIYDAHRFAKVTLSERAKDMVGVNSPRDASAGFNRILLEDAYPQEIRKHQKAHLRLVNNNGCNPSNKEIDSGEVIQTIGDLNRRVFTVALWVLPVALCGFLLGTELPVLQRKCLGWVQAPNLVSYDKARVKTLDFDEIADVLAMASAWGFQTNQNQSKLTWAKIIQDDTLKLTVSVVKPTIEEANRGRKWFPWFLAAALFVEWLSLVIIAWMVAKILFIVWILLSARWVNIDADAEEIAPHSRILSLFGIKARFQVGLNFEDGEKRYGLAMLDSVYNRIFILGIMLGCIYWIGRLTNLAKGTAFTLEAPDWFFTGQTIIPGAIVVTVSAICLYPVYHLYGSVLGAKERMLEDPDIGDSRKALIRDQSVWPPGWDSRYVKLVGGCLAFAILLPLGLDGCLKLFGVGNAAVVSAKFVRTLQRLICWLS